MASRKLCPEMCPDAVRSRSKLTKRQPISYARTGLKSFDLRPDLKSLPTLANRRLSATSPRFCKYTARKHLLISRIFLVEANFEGVF